MSFDEPDIKLIREIVVNLERKSRSIMMQYRNTLLDDIDILDNFRSIIYDVENLFPDKHYDVEINVSLDEEISNKNTNKLRVLVIIVKELLNNIYKHSQGKTINLNLYSVNDGYRLKIISDGTKREDYLNILNSKSGVLFIKFLVDSNGGTVDYFYENGILMTEVFIKCD
ncbi:hypothetical protein [uncultured Anaerococcus sp.]|uniref:hypothetical protein n=1 Tax=uncultured Anaerococcus sp. TaxID=293428 RepID=UPI00260158D8|nr:hypothetical protein [uncultured Anaerococcus sp.]